MIPSFSAIDKGLPASFCLPVRSAEPSAFSGVVHGLWDSSGIGPLIGSAAPDYFQPVEQAPSHITMSFIEASSNGQTGLRRIV
jgi:hypothetical protein